MKHPTFLEKLHAELEQMRKDMAKTRRAYESFRRVDNERYEKLEKEYRTYKQRCVDYAEDLRIATERAEHTEGQFTEAVRANRVARDIAEQATARAEEAEARVKKLETELAEAEIQYKNLLAFVSSTENAHFRAHYWQSVRWSRAWKHAAKLYSHSFNVAMDRLEEQLANDVDRVIIVEDRDNEGD